MPNQGVKGFRHPDLPHFIAVFQHFSFRMLGFGVSFRLNSALTIY